MILIYVNNVEMNEGRAEKQADAGFVHNRNKGTLK